MKNKKVQSLAEKKRKVTITNMVMVLAKKAFIFYDHALVKIGSEWHNIKVNTFEAVKAFIRRQILQNPGLIAGV